MNIASMSRSLARALAGFAFAAVALLVAVPAQAKVVIDDKGACVWAWDATTSTLSCAPAGPPICSVSGPANGTVGTPITLTAVCLPVAASYVWAGGSCAGITTAACSASEPAGTVNYTVQGTNTNGGGLVSAAFPVAWSSTPAFACSFSPSPGAATVGTGLPLTVACTNGTLASVTWAAGAPAGCSGSCIATFASPNPTLSGSNSVTLPSAGVWNISATVTSALGATASVPAASVQATAAQGQQPGAYNCGTSFANTRTLTMPAWVVGAAAHVHVYTANAGHLGPYDAVVLEITTPAVLGSNAFGNISWSDIGSDPPAQRVLVLSDKACDFTTGVNANPLASVANVNNGSLWFTAGSNTYNYPALTLPNQKYYLNIKNAAGACTSVTGHCDLDLEFTIPH